MRQKVYATIKKSKTLEKAICEMASKKLEEREPWTATVVFELLEEVYLANTFFECQMHEILTNMFRCNYELPIVYYWIVARLVYALPEKWELEELLEEAFSHLDRVTECDLLSVAEVLEWLLTELPSLITVFTPACRAIEHRLLERLMTQPAKLRQLLKFLSLVVDCHARAQ